MGVDARGREMLTYLDGETVGDSVPWPAWTHSDTALVDIGNGCATATAPSPTSFRIPTQSGEKDAPGGPA